MSKILLLALATILSLLQANGSNPSSREEKPVADFHIADTTGQSRSLDEFKHKKALVIVFIGTQCPIANSYTPTLIELHEHYAKIGIQLLAINSNKQDSLEDVRVHARERKLPFPVLKDSAYKAADTLGARRTPEAFLLDSKRIIRYRGRIDNQYGYTYRRSAPSRTELRDAIEELLAGKPISVTKTEVQGCIIGR
jgi:peroxiredoxin